MKKYFVVMMMFCFCILTTGCVKTTSSDDKGNERTEFTIGETAIVNNNTIKINSVKKIYSECLWEYDGECYSSNEPDKDYFLIIDLTIENNGDEEISISSLLQFELKHPDGEKASQNIMLNAINSSLDGSIMPNDILKGQIAYDVADADYYYFYYQDSLLDNSIKFKINKSDIKE